MLRSLLLGFILIAASPAMADSWSRPTPKTVVSPDGLMRVTIVPRPMTNQLDYFEDKGAGKEPAAAPIGSVIRTAKAAVELKDGGRWTPVRDHTLLNEVAPVLAIVNDAGFLATLDNWYSVGLGEHVLVIYAPDGKVVRSFTLLDLLPEAYTGGLRRSVSSLHWRRDIRLSPDQQRLIIDVAVPDESERFSEGDGSLPLEIELATARVLPRDPLRWSHAEAAAARVAAGRGRWEAEALAFRRSQLSPPGSSREEEWHRYLREAFARLDPDWCDPRTCEGLSSTGTTVLRLPSAPDYAASEQWLKDDLTKGNEVPELVDVRTIGSPDQDNLVATIERFARRTRIYALRGVRLYVVATPDRAERVRKALVKSGAAIVMIDPNVPIPQRPQVLAALDELAAKRPNSRSRLH